MVQIFYFINIRYLPSILFGLPIDYQDFLSPAFTNPNEAYRLKENLVDIILEEMRKVDRKRVKLNKKAHFQDFLKSELEEWIEIDQRFLAKVRS